MRMDVFANGRNAGRVCEDGVDDFHALQSSETRAFALPTFCTWGTFGFRVIPKKRPS
jgi:hypothetical protein